MNWADFVFVCFWQFPHTFESFFFTEIVWEGENCMQSFLSSNPPWHKLISQCSFMWQYWVYKPKASVFLLLWLLQSLANSSFGFAFDHHHNMDKSQFLKHLILVLPGPFLLEKEHSRTRVLNQGNLCPGNVTF